tara:strand:+ start:163509 stop:164267 length:759 start_codon:yes stop_codon:yes gene_type:complete
LIFKKIDIFIFIIIKLNYNKMTEYEVEILLSENDIYCPITFCIFNEPTLASDGFYYEKDIIQAIFKKNKTSPITGKELINKFEIDYEMKKIIDEYLKKNPDKMNEVYKKKPKNIYDNTLFNNLEMPNLESIDLNEITKSEFINFFLIATNSEIEELINKTSTSFCKPFEFEFKNKNEIIIGTAGLNHFICCWCDLELILKCYEKYKIMGWDFWDFDVSNYSVLEYMKLNKRNNVNIYYQQLKKYEHLLPLKN